ncbi:hypothetical protein [Brevibacillus reuszeri]|uniref:hypothetical protein n=1 Tax=Brevibacillus reuszeri TaxID=54915 RepID=UPI000CCC2FCB|nr:hypothetical protein [Brevibacillus reuszeri]
MVLKTGINILMAILVVLSASQLFLNPIDKVLMLDADPMELWFKLPFFEKVSSISVIIVYIVLIVMALTRLASSVLSILLIVYLAARQIFEVRRGEK